MKSGLIYIYIYIYIYILSHSVLLEKIIHTQQDFYTLPWVSMNARFLFRPSISKGVGGGGGGLGKSFGPKFQSPSPLFYGFLLVGSVYLLPLIQRLAYRVACSIVVVSL